MLWKLPLRTWYWLKLIELFVDKTFEKAWGFLSPCWLCCFTSSQLHGGDFLSTFSPFATWRCQLLFWGKTPHVKPPLPQTKRQNRSQTLFHPWRVKTSPQVTVRLGRSSKVTTEQRSEIHKSAPRRQRRQRGRKIRKWQCEAGGLIFAAVTSGEAVFLLAFRRQSWRWRESTVFAAGGDPNGSREGGGRGQEGAYLEHKG